VKIIMAAYAGACYGVKRALDLTNEAAEKAHSVQTLGPLIHNPQVVAGLERKGVSVADTPKDISSDCIVIRSHGVTPDVMKQVKESGATIVDATCPHVMRAQKAAARMGSEGRTVVVVGEAHHPEVQGLVAWARQAGHRVVVASRAKDLPQDLSDPIGVVVQTTQMQQKLDEVVDELQRRGLHPEVKDTICAATSQRQNAARKVAHEVDAMVIIGGHNSSNTTRLFEICKQIVPKSFQIETASELNPKDFEGCQTVGVTAGASTPDNEIEEVVDVLKTY